MTDSEDGGLKSQQPGTPCVAVVRSSGMSWEAPMARGSSI